MRMLMGLSLLGASVGSFSFLISPPITNVSEFTSFLSIFVGFLCLGAAILALEPILYDSHKRECLDD